MRKLALEHSSVIDYRMRLAMTLSNLGNLCSNTGRWPEAERYFREAISLQKSLVEVNPDLPSLRAYLALSRHNFGIHLLERDRAAEALVETRAGIELRKKLVDDNPTIADYRESLATSYGGLGWLFTTQGQRERPRIDNKCLSIFRVDQTSSRSQRPAATWLMPAIIHNVVNGSRPGRSPARSGRREERPAFHGLINRGSKSMNDRGGYAEPCFALAKPGSPSDSSAMQLRGYAIQLTRFKPCPPDPRHSHSLKDAATPSMPRPWLAPAQILAPPNPRPRPLSAS